jgi:hypothetical protein
LLFLYNRDNFYLIVGDLLAFARVGSHITNVTFIVHLGALAVRADDLALQLLSIEALGVLLAPYVGDLLAHKALIIAMTTIVRGPQLVVR